ncbi:MAG: hypothetical protein OXG15_16515 [Gammaproteobacteria bacterium]|nr:hypothetical protein [Gammaproteobacteria bacterium]
MLNIDTAQWRVMHSLCVKNMIRSSGALRMDRRSEPTPRHNEITETLLPFLGFGVLSVLAAVAVSISTYPVGEFLVISFLSLLVYGGVADQCSTHLFANKELHVYGALPISAATHLASKISGSIAYYSLVCGGITVPAFLVILVTRGFFAGIGWVVSIELCVVFLCFAAIYAHSFSVRVVRGTKLRYVQSIVGLVFLAFVLALCVVMLLHDVELSEVGKSWNLEENPLFLLFPPYWFIALLLFLDGHTSTTVFVGALLAAFGSIPIGLYLFKRIDTAFLAALSDSTANVGTTGSKRYAIALFPSLRFGLLGYERTAMWKLAFSHLRRDSIFRSVFSTYFGLFFVWTVLLIKNKNTTEILSDPFAASDPAWFLTMTSAVLFICVFALFEVSRTSNSAPACWALFVSPSNHTRFTAMVVDWIFVVFALPTLLLVFIASSIFWQSTTSAFLHIFTLGWLCYFAANMKSIVNPALPFTRQAGSSPSSLRICLNFCLTVIAGVVIFYTLGSWIYSSYTTASVSILLGVVICVAVRYLAYRTYDREFSKADLIS